MQKSKKFIILGQFFIAMMMAFLMTFIFTAFPSGFAPGWFSNWMARFFTAWPIAFGLSLVVGPLAFKLATLVLHRHFAVVSDD